MFFPPQGIPENIVVFMTELLHLQNCLQEYILYKYIYIYIYIYLSIHKTKKQKCDAPAQFSVAVCH